MVAWTPALMLNEAPPPATVIESDASKQSFRGEGTIPLTLPVTGTTTMVIVLDCAGFGKKHETRLDVRLHETWS